jgi:di/tricarboxylate transporter
MTMQQGLAFAILIATILLFAWDKLRYDLVAMISLAAGVVSGLVPAERAFHGFSDPVVVVIAAALVVSAGIERSGVIERLMKPLGRLKSPDALIGTLAGLVMVLSAFMKNIGALAIFIPLALRLARTNAIPASQILMPLSFASLVGGLMTLIGTSPNIIVSRVRADLLGKPFAMFDFAPVGLGVCLCAILFLAFAWRVLPKDRQGTGEAKGQAFRIEDYLAEVRILPHSPLIGATVLDLEQLFSGGAVTVAAIVRDQGHRYVPGGHWEFSQGDVLVLEGDPVALNPLLDQAGLQLLGAGADQAGLAVREAVVMPNSPLVGTTAMQNAMRRRYGISVLAISRGGRHMISRLRQTEFLAGDVLVVEGEADSLPGTLKQLGCLPLGARQLRPSVRKGAEFLPLAITFAAMALVAFGILPVAAAFFLAALCMILTRCLPLRDAYEAIHWPIIILLGGLIPISDAMRATGASDLMAGWLAMAAAQLPVEVAVGLVLLASMLLAPFLHHAATVLLMGPVAAAMASRMGLAIDPFLMAVAVGAACDFLTPIGHQCNTLVMGVGGYRFGDYWRLGLPLSLIVLVAGTGLILLVWPLHL